MFSESWDPCAFIFSGYSPHPLKIRHKQKLHLTEITLLSIMKITSLGMILQCANVTICSDICISKKVNAVWLVWVSQVTGKAHLLFHLGTRISSDLCSVLVFPSIKKSFFRRVGEDISGSGGQAGLPSCLLAAQACLAIAVLLEYEERNCFSGEHLFTPVLP